MSGEFQISTDKTQLDINLIADYLLNEAYWSKGRSLELVEKSIEHSLCFGVYTQEGQQLAFARIVTDYVVFAWIMDVFVIDKFKGKGVGKLLIDYMMRYPDLKNVKGMGLRTEDAQGFYEKFGFGTILEPETWMFKRNRNI
ncbi:GNAT family N-acetyltransferase [Spongiimicrobium salis]|uniref:GNAT family N-acetyltransferase n=1 Tax=Spongiimicrobium salis TaxID=1667022 RepID=UPI00374DBD97